MKTKLVIRSLTVLVMALLVLGVVYPVSANSTVISVENLTGSTVLAGDSEANPCTFELVDSITGSIKYVSQFDRSGKLVSKLSIYGNVKENLTANGKTVNVQIYGPTQAKYTYYPDKIVVVETLVGTTNLVTIPGQGMVKGGGGQAQMTTVYTTDWQFISWTFNYRIGSLSPDWGAVCAYLAP